MTSAAVFQYDSNKIVTLISMILYVPINNFSVMSGWVFLGWTSTKQQIKFIAQGHNTLSLPAVFAVDEVFCSRTQHIASACSICSG